MGSRSFTAVAVAVAIAVAICGAFAPPTLAADAPTLDRIATLLGDSIPAGASLSVATIVPNLPAACDLRQASPARPLVASGRIALRLEGRGCPRWIWADIELRTPRAPVGPSGPAVGSRVRILVRVGSLVVEEVGRLVPCSRGVACAVVPSGKHVEGRLEAGTLVVEAL
jgi:hypothetical protein